MKPPFCPACAAAPENQEAYAQGGYVKFADYTPVPSGMAGHPKGYEWFCRKHLARAQKLSDLTLPAALASFKRWRL